ncbi:MAG: alcohol dehydrogenase catalytic domain-containing protein [Chloroflexota bacterium]|nr:alcohol dehydrogenase catalytic domain-containing protein [Chloroflexota bacterium]
MAETTVAALCLGAFETELRELPLPDIPPEGGLLEMEAAGVCGSDWNSYRRPGPPRIMGHENVGHVAKLGTLAAKRWGVREGDRVALEEYVPCGHCALCRSGDFRLCDETEPSRGGLRYGSTPVSVEPGLWGGYSRYLYVHPNAVIHAAPAHAPAEQLAMSIPLSNGVQWATREVSAPGRTFLIEGPGQQGLACALAAKAAGAACIIVSGLHRDAARLEVARALGADFTVDVETEDLRERVHAITAGKGVDASIDVAGGPGTLVEAIHCTTKAGTVLFATSPDTVADFPAALLTRKRLTVRALRGHSYAAVEESLRLIGSGAHPLHLMSTHRFSVEQVDLAIRSVGGEGVPGAIHVCVVPQ